jgi:hypothetical protein
MMHHVQLGDNLYIALDITNVTHFRPTPIFALDHEDGNVLTCIVLSYNACMSYVYIISVFMDHRRRC